MLIMAHKIEIIIKYMQFYVSTIALACNGKFKVYLCRVTAGPNAFKSA